MYAAVTAATASPGPPRQAMVDARSVEQWACRFRRRAQATVRAIIFAFSAKWRFIFLLHASGCKGKLPPKASGGILMDWAFWRRPADPRRRAVEYTADERKVFEATRRIGPALLVAAVVG